MRYLGRFVYSATELSEQVEDKDGSMHHDHHKNHYDVMINHEDVPHQESCVPTSFLSSLSPARLLLAAQS